MPQNVGRPTVGPKIETRVSANTLSLLDADANRRMISRAEWLRDAVEQGLPYEALTHPGRRSLADALADIDGLAGLRDWALTPEAPQEERVIAAERYAGTIYEMRTMISALEESLPRKEARDAYVQADADDPQMVRGETARAWARATAADHLARLLDVISLLLPVDGALVQKRAGLDDPRTDIDAD
ncbi:hypothetical protein [Streptomyces triculaminicus]|uniref:hypothetical protein n=1 Tax=Streptomyces triculaminicus TaxID=2816232 RepID=UPI0037B0723A